ncbi:N-acetyltransferase [Candidatus Omnitrophota bacterium]
MGNNLIRKAKIQDIKALHALINSFAGDDLMLPRSLSELYDNLRDYWVAQEGRRIVGCCALHVSWGDLAEVKSLAVAKRRQKKGIGGLLLAASLDEAKELGAKKVFALTYVPRFFSKNGFKRIKHAQLPHKIWAECIKCPKFPECDEIAMIKNIS